MPTPHTSSERPALRLPGLAAAMVSALLLTGCQSIDMSSAQLRVIDASPDAGPLDAYQNSTGLAYNLNFGTLTSYVAMSPGGYTLAADKGGTRQTLATHTVTLLPGRQYTEIVGSGLANLHQTLLLDQSTPAPQGQIALRFVAQATRSGAVDVYLVAAGGHAAFTAPLTTNLSFGTNSGYINAPAGTYGIVVVPVGTALTNASVTLLTGDQRSYDSGAVRTIVLLDQEIVGAHSAGLTAGVSVVVADDAD